MYFLSLIFAAVALDATKTPSDPVLQTNHVSGRAVSVLEGTIDPNIQDLSFTQQAVGLPAQPPNPNPNPNPNPTPDLEPTIPLVFNDVPYPDFLEKICKYPKQLACCWVQSGQKFCDYYSNIESKECANYQNWRCCEKIDRINFRGIKCKKFQVKEPVPKIDEQPPEQQGEESPPEQVQLFPDQTWNLPDWLNWIMFSDPLWQNQ